jgi:hypothetical protein
MMRRKSATKQKKNQSKLFFLSFLYIHSKFLVQHHHGEFRCRLNQGYCGEYLGNNFRRLVRSAKIKSGSLHYGKT